MENARLHAQAVRRSRDLEALYRADEALYRSVRMDQVLQALVDVAADVLHADKTSVHMWDLEHRHLEAVASHGFNPDTISQPLVPGIDLPMGEQWDTDVFTISDAASDPRFASPRMRELVQREGILAVIGARITVAGEPFGLFAVAFCRPHSPSGDEQRLVQALAQRAGLAIQNARLFEQAQQVATAEERQRLARELHDAVTQTLFSASLIAEVVPRLWERDPNEGRQLQIRRRQRSPMTSLEQQGEAWREPASVDVWEQPEWRVEWRESASEMRSALAELPQSQRQALTLHYLEDRPYDEIAASMGVPLNTVKSHILRGKERMLRLLAGHAQSGRRDRGTQLRCTSAALMPGCELSVSLRLAPAT